MCSSDLKGDLLTLSITEANLFIGTGATLISDPANTQFGKVSLPAEDDPSAVGFTAPTFEAIRCGADRDAVFANIERLLAMKARHAGPPPIVEVQYSMMEGNEHEVEPFKAAIALGFARPPHVLPWLLLYLAALFAAGLFVERFFCRYLCPLGAALAIPARLRMFEWLKRDDVLRISDTIVNQDFPGRATIPCIGTDRADLILPGCAILNTIMENWPCATLRVADRGLREGLLISLLRESEAPSKLSDGNGAAS